MDKIIICDHHDSPGEGQPNAGLMWRHISHTPIEELGKPYADFNALAHVWKGPEEIERVGFFGRRKYIMFPEAPVNFTRTPWGPIGWCDASAAEFHKYRVWLSKWDGAGIKPLLARNDMIVTPPWELDRPIMQDFAETRSQQDAHALTHALRERGVDTFSKHIHPYIFITRWSVFNRFMMFAMPLAAELEPLCKGADSTNEAYKKRPMAYVLERAFSLWLEKSRLETATLPILNCWEI
jgi:hypothetical protein